MFTQNYAKMFTHNTQKLRKCIYAKITHISHAYAIILRRFYANNLRNSLRILRSHYANNLRRFYANDLRNSLRSLRSLRNSFTQTHLRNYHNFFTQFYANTVFITQVYAKGNLLMLRCVSCVDAQQAMLPPAAQLSRLLVNF
jgi:hypothetical protein